jgi:hypothetical protein
MTIPLFARIAEIEGRLARLESAPQLKYLGTYKTEKVYSENSLITHDGSLWIALKSTSEKRGTSGGLATVCEARL